MCGPTELWRCATAEGTREMVDEALNVRLQGVLAKDPCQRRITLGTVSVREPESTNRIKCADLSCARSVAQEQSCSRP
jgi:hypothetical protein